MTCQECKIVQALGHLKDGPQRFIVFCPRHSPERVQKLEQALRDLIASWHNDPFSKRFKVEAAQDALSTDQDKP